MKKQAVNVLLGLVIAVLMCLGCNSLVHAETSGHYSYTVKKDGTIKIIGYNGSSANIVIPAKIAGKKVTEIGGWSFEDLDSLKSVEVPNGVVSIGDSAFRDCINLKKVKLPSGLTTISDYVFRDCTSLETINLPSGMKSIGQYCFYECDSLKKLEFPSGITNIYSSCCWGCDNLESVKISSTVKMIGSSAFGSCISLKSVDIPQSMVSIGRLAFSDCLSLNSIKFYSKNCMIDDSSDTIYHTATIYGYKGSTAQKYAQTNGRNFAEMCEHQYKDTVSKKASVNADGKMIRKCVKCNNETSEKIYRPKIFKLSTSVYTYNGKVRKPSVTVKDSKGSLLKKNKDYSVTYSKGCMAVGKYTVKVTFKGAYSGEKSLTFTIKPKTVAISKLTVSGKAFTVKWEKSAAQTTGYRIQYSMNKNFKSAKNVTVKNVKTVTKKISGLKAKKKYYVRISAYKTVKVNGKSTNIYSDWSKVKSVTTKK